MLQHVRIINTIPVTLDKHLLQSSREGETNIQAEVKVEEMGFKTDLKELFILYTKHRLIMV
jgi:hypothetical protein